MGNPGGNNTQGRQLFLLDQRLLLLLDLQDLCL